MLFDPKNHVIKLCTQGMQLEGEAKLEEASQAFQQAWNEATNDLEKLTAAHYVARQQNSIEEKLKWDKIALGLALNVNTAEIKATYPSLYLNIAKGYEDLKEFDKARENYLLALSYTNFLLSDGYGNMIRSGISQGVERVS